LTLEEPPTGGFSFFYEREGAMDEPKFEVGQQVRLVRRLVHRSTPDTVYEIARVMPSDDREHCYRIKALHENHERAVRESEIESAFRG
jgi:hypothetical protein